MNKTVTIISGPCGVGKSTLSRELSKTNTRTALIVGDNLMDFLEAGEPAPWEERLSLTWKNILALTRNCVENGYDVVIDYVVEDELDWFRENLRDLHATVRYLVLTADEETLRQRLSQRGDEYLVERSLFLLRQLTSAAENQNHLVNTTGKTPAEIIQEINMA